jgi:hypothetical protein
VQGVVIAGDEVNAALQCHRLANSSLLTVGVTQQRLLHSTYSKINTRPTTILRATVDTADVT